MAEIMLPRSPRVSSVTPSRASAPRLELSLSAFMIPAIASLALSPANPLTCSVWLSAARSEAPNPASFARAPVVAMTRATS